MTTRLLLTVALSIVVVLATLALLVLVGPDWAAYAPATCTATRCFCEAPRPDALLLQPANSWSSFAFVVVGLWILLGARGTGRATALGALPTAWLGLTAIVTGVGSVMLHATLTLWGQFVDVLGMYLLGAFVLTWAWVRWRGLSGRAGVAIYLVTSALLTATLVVVPETRRWLFAVVLLAAIAVEWVFARPRRPGVSARPFVTGLLVNAAAFGIWILDNSLTVCAPDSPAQGHALWHVLGAVAVGFLAAYYRGEEARAR